jgi:A/G-specific adenine glycosylase
LNSRQLKEFREALLAWFSQFQRDLPWRHTGDPYRIWVSEVMLQQTRVAAVIPYYERFLARFPDVRALAEAPQEEVLRLWSGLGYYHRARNLQRAAQQIISRHADKFPRTHAEIKELAGIGEYTAAAVSSIAFGERLAVLDGNVARVLARLDAIRGDLREPKRWSGLQARADELLAPERPGDWNQAVMELGATLCTPRSPQCLLCPVQGFCEARKLGLTEGLPEKRKNRAVVSIYLAAAVLVDELGHSLLLPPPGNSNQHRGDDHVPSLVAKLWHFPTASVQSDAETSLKNILDGLYAMKRWSAFRGERLQAVRHTVTYRKIHIAPFLVRVSRLPKLIGARSAPLDELMEQPISNLTRKVARQAAAHLSESKKAE